MIELVVYIPKLCNRTWIVKVENDWALQNTIEDGPKDDIYFFDTIPEGYKEVNNDQSVSAPAESSRRTGERQDPSG